MAEIKYKDLEDVAPINKDPDDAEQTFMSEMRERFSRCLDFDRELRLKALEDRALPGKLGALADSVNKLLPEGKRGRAASISSQKPHR